jgi:DNA polymerase-3 subunit gamma/tau
MRALYRKYRSKSLDEVVGQRHITDILARAIKAGRISHAYLLTGPKGVGKTSVARILAHEINQLPYSDDTTHLDIIEIDAASNNGVEDIRDLREKVQLAPVSASKKVYIIDEVHMLSKAAFNALLKTLEEPPAHVVFILATTDADKLPATIVSRTQRYGFRAIGEADAVTHLRSIADAEKIKIDDDSLKLIARRGDGSFRDSIGLLDQLASLSDEKTGITPELVEATLGLAPSAVIEQILQLVRDRDLTSLAALLEETASDGIGAVLLTEQLTQAIRENVASSPELLPLLDQLLDVARSSQPHLKLLAVLGTFIGDHKSPKSVALIAPVREVTATIAELTKQATRIHPKEPAVVVNQSDQPMTGRELPNSGSLQPESFLGSEPRKARREAKPESGSSPAQTLDWTALIEQARTNFVPLYSVLSKCTPEQDGNVVTLYTGNNFYKKKLDDQKYNAHLYAALKNIGVSELTIHTVPTAPPLKSSQAAAVAAIMGGGEEVAVSA